MKLILCPKCGDVRKMRLKKWTYCECRKSAGRYIDDLYAEIKGSTVPLGINNAHLEYAVNNRHDQGHGPTFDAWVISVKCPTVLTVKKVTTIK